MSAWQQLVQQGVLGTERQAMAPSLDPSLAVLLQPKSTAPDAEETFLQMATILTQYERVGRQPATITAQQRETLNSAPPESLTPVDEHQTLLLRQIVGEFDLKLVLEWLAHGTNQGIHLPPDLLPTLLERATKDRSLATALAPCLGERGRWLIALNPAWEIAAAEQIDDAS